MTAHQSDPGPRPVGLSGRTAPRVLVLDDCPDNADSLATLLDVAGFEAHVFYRPHEALAALDRVRPDACLIDLMMPGMDGAEVGRRVRAWAGDRYVRLVAVTARADEKARRLTAAAGFDLHLVKPVDPDRLATLVGDLIVLGDDPTG
jgi:CheY-like chemotaxis protein